MMAEALSPDRDPLSGARPNGWSGGAVPARRSDGSICSSALGSGVVSDTVLGWPAAGRV